MKKIEAVVQPHKVDAVKEALKAAGGPTKIGGCAD